MSLTARQVEQLLQPIAPSRVLKDRDGLSHVSQQDVRAHLNRIFGFGGWSDEIVELTCVRDGEKKVPPKNGKPERLVPAVTYLCRLRLTVRDSLGYPLASYEDVGTGTSPNLPDHGDAHDFAAKNAVSYALKRCATNLGDQFGLSLYNKGQLAPLVIDTLVKPEPDLVQRAEGAPAEDMQSSVPQQVDLGDERPADEQPPTPALDPELAQAKARVWAAAKARGFDSDVLINDFGRNHGGQMLSDADVPTLLAYAGELENAT